MFRTIFKPLAFAAAIALSPLVVAAPVAVPGTTVTLDAPTGFVAAERFPGFQREDLGASIMVTELPAPADDMKKAMTKDALASRGMTLHSAQTVKVGGVESVLLHVSQTANGMEFLKWMLVTGDPSQTVMVVGTFPKAAEAAASDPVRKAVLSTTRDASAKADPWAGLPFRIEPTAKLKLARRITNMLVLTQSGTVGPGGSPGDPVYVVGESVSNVASTDVEALSRTRLSQTAQIKDLRNVEGRNLTVGGLGAYELVADATHVQTGDAVRVCQTIALDGRGYVIFLGIVGSALADTYLPEFRSVTASFRRVTAER